MIRALPSPKAMRPPPGRYLVLAAAGLLASCAAPPTGPTSPPAPSTAPPRTVPVPEARLPRFEQQQLDRAEQAARDGRLAESAVAWEVLTLLRPTHEPYLSGLAQARKAIDTEVAQRLAKATLARQRGDLAGAERAWLEALAADPFNGVASRSLRDLERERNRSTFVGRFASPPGVAAANGNAKPARPAAASRGTEGDSVPLPGQRNALEHASMLASQGEADAAINLLVEQYSSWPSDPQVRAKLANLHVQRADQLAGRDRAGAVADLERSMLLNPRNEQARAKLQQLRRPAPP